ncbi:unnamed protein product [Adineta steineri]|uniref:Uncharacterized protein n=1 Tax=Adineta steineri TaxID=433720 RepID=A0A815QWG4_9BILA|nr:unnamed protein product [Adineta steineri]CAF1468844.1 unnamed protein product [Adineta steineri]CAF1469359.1 unnamed protein product [Adineta steineri]
MKILLYLTSFIVCYSFEICVQPYFPPQIVFSFDDGQPLYAIDEINQRAYQSFTVEPWKPQQSYLMKKFPYAIPDSPQSKYYVELVLDPIKDSCIYTTFWKYGAKYFSDFPSHWISNGSSLEIKSFINFTYPMIHSTNFSSPDEDYWYANQTCKIDSGEIYPCQEIYFKKNTQIPLRLTQVISRDYRFIQTTINYNIISMGKPDDKYFNSIPKDWFTACKDLDLGISYYPEFAKIYLHESAKFFISLSTPPHRINGNDTVRIQFNTTDCMDCFTISRKEFTFNTKNFNENQTLTITRMKDASQTTIIPIIYGGGFANITPHRFPLYID